MKGHKICRIPRFDFSVNDDKPLSVSLNSPGSAVCKEKKSPDLILQGELRATISNQRKRIIQSPLS